MTGSTDYPELAPDWSLHPGELLLATLKQKGLRQSELAERTGLTAKHVNQMIKGGIGISADVAVFLERALGVPARFWINADADHQAFLSEERAKRNLPSYFEWANSFDTSTLKRYRIISPTEPQPTRVEKLLRFFGVASPEAFEETWLKPRVSFRRSQAFSVSGYNTVLWIRLVERSVEHLELPNYQPTPARKTAQMLAAMTTQPVVDGFAAARLAFAKVGVALTVVRQVPGTRVSGALWWTNAERPIVGLTERHRHPDNFWFTVAHEVGHLVLHPKRATFLDLDDGPTSPDDAEKEADAFAEATLLPPGADDRIAHARTKNELRLLAAEFRVGLPTVAGRHGHLTQDWKVGGGLRGKITDDDLTSLEIISSEPLGNGADGF